MKRTFAFFGGTGLLLVAVTALAVESAGSVGVVSIEPVTQLVLTPRARIANDHSGSILVELEMEGSEHPIHLGRVPAGATDSFRLPFAYGQAQILITAVGDRAPLMTTTVTINHRTDVPIVVSGSQGKGKSHPASDRLEGCV